MSSIRMTADVRVLSILYKECRHAAFLPGVYKQFETREFVDLIARQETAAVEIMYMSTDSLRDAFRPL